MGSIHIASVREVVGLLALAGLLPSRMAAGAGTEPATRKAQIRHLKAKIHVDGRLDEPIWSQLAPLGHFVQTEPDEGAPAMAEIFCLPLPAADKLVLLAMADHPLHGVVLPKPREDTDSFSAPKRL